MDTSYLTQQVTTIIIQLHTLFDDIGVPSHERDARESELFSSLSETLHNHLRLVSSEKNELVEEAKRLITTIQQIQVSLDDNPACIQPKAAKDDLVVTFPLHDCLQALEEKYRTLSKLHQERFEQVKKLVQALQSYSSHLEPSFVQIKLPTIAADGTVPPTFDLSPTYISSVDSEFSRVYDEYNRRVLAVQQTSEEIVKLWAELGTPQALTDSTIVQCYRDAPEQLGLHQADIKRLWERKEKLLEEKRCREKHMKDLRLTIEALWDRLRVPEVDRKAFSAGNRGCGLRAINDLEDELTRLNELKRQNLHLFVEDARTKLHNLWDELFFSEEEAVEFTPMFCDVYSDALLSAHESEIARLEALKDQRAPTLQLISKHRSLVKDQEDLAASSQDASRLLLKPAKGERRDPTRLLREEKMRKRIAKELPKIAQELSEVLEVWEEEYGRSFLVFGERYLDVLGAAATKSLPVRSKTPNGLSSTSRPPTAAGTASRTATLRGPPPTLREPSAAHSKTPGGGTITRNPLAMSMSAASTRSPSKLPGRTPLSSMPNGGNSPERTGRLAAKTTGGTTGSLNKMPAAGVTMAPPPRMRNLFVPLEAATPAAASSFGGSDASSTTSSVVRHIPPDDPYREREHFSRSAMPSFAPRAAASHALPTLAPSVNRPAVQQPPRTTPGSPLLVAPMRQISNASSTATTAASHVSSSENWEAYDDGDDDTVANPTEQSRSLLPLGTGDNRNNNDTRHHPSASVSTSYYTNSVVPAASSGMAVLKKLNAYRGGIPTAAASMRPVALMATAGRHREAASASTSGDDEAF